MSVAKVIEILAQSDKSWEDAAQNAVTAASRSVRNIKTVYVEGMQAIVEGDKITGYRVNTKISFIVE